MKSVPTEIRPAIQYPLDQLVSVKFNNWKYKRFGYIKKDTSLVAGFYFITVLRPYRRRAISTADPPLIIELNIDRTPKIIETKNKKRTALGSRLDSSKHKF
jgi:hypothetical protein